MLLALLVLVTDVCKLLSPVGTAGDAFTSCSWRGQLPSTIRLPESSEVSSLESLEYFRLCDVLSLSLPISAGSCSGDYLAKESDQSLAPNLVVAVGISTLKLGTQSRLALLSSGW